jgi:hypothetical protein
VGRIIEMSAFGRLICLLAFLPVVAMAQQWNPPVVATAAGSTGAVVAAMPAVQSRTNWLCGFDVSAAGGTATISPVTIAGTLTGNLVYQGISAGGLPFVVRFNPCLPASAQNSAISVTTTADGTASAVDVQAYGFLQQ